MTDIEKKVGNPKWVKGGVSGNPLGRPPKGDSMADLIDSIGSEVLAVGSENMTRKERMARKAYELAFDDSDKNLSLQAMKWLTDRSDGKAKETIFQINTEPIKVFNRDEVDTG
tara:strand:- start:9341 stop:9679 length:339 start_codon:yes stop_codon:yes gene_type:complete